MEILYITQLLPALVQFSAKAPSLSRQEIKEFFFGHIMVKNDIFVQNRLHGASG